MNTRSTRRHNEIENTNQLIFNKNNRNQPNNQSIVNHMANPTPSASAALFTPISAPILRSVDPVEIARFIKERDRYEVEIESKQGELPNLKPLPYQASIDRSLLKNLLFMGDFEEFAPDAETVEEISNDQIKSFIESKVSFDDEEEANPQVILNALKGLRMPMHITNPKARVSQYCNEFLERLDAVGYGAFKTKNPKKTIELLASKVYPTKLKNEMKRRLEYNENLRTDLKSFVKLLKEQAVAVQTYDKPAPATSSTISPTHTEGTTDNNNDKMPICLWEPHQKRGIRHRLKDCKSCPKDEKDRLFEQLRKRKTVKLTRQAHNHDKKADDNSVMFAATFGEKIKITVCTDTCADDNIMDSKTLATLESESVDMKVETLQKPRKFYMAASLPDGNPAVMIITKTVTLNMELHVRHGTAIVLRNMKWLVTDQHMTEPLIGRPILQALGLDARKILQSAADRLNGSFDFSSILQNDEKPTGTVARLFEGIYHSSGGVDDHDLRDDDGWLDIGPDSPTEKEKIINSKVDSAMENGMSKQGASQLRDLLHEFDDVVAIRLSSPVPADVEPMIIQVKPGTMPIKAKSRRYSPEKREFMDKYVKRHLSLGLVEK